MQRIDGLNEMVNHGVTYHDVEQGTQEWLECRRGLLTASGMKNLVTKTGKVAKNDDVSSYIYERSAERITGHIEDGYVSNDMFRGLADEPVALALYSEKISRVRVGVGFITNNRYGFVLGYSPDALVGDVGLIECKSRLSKHQVKTWLDGKVPAEYMAQIQTGLLVAEDREWCDFISFSAGMALFRKRVYPDEEWQEAILEAALAAETQIAAFVEIYNQRTAGAIIAPWVTTV